MSAVPVRAAGPPAPTWWTHHCAVAWTAAWVKVRGHDLVGARELLDGDEWSGEISWQDRSGFKTAKHRPDLVALRRGGRQIPIEVELTKKSAELFPGGGLSLELLDMIKSQALDGTSRPRRAGRRRSRLARRHRRVEPQAIWRRTEALG